MLNSNMRMLNALMFFMGEPNGTLEILLSLRLLPPSYYNSVCIFPNKFVKMMYNSQI